MFFIMAAMLSMVKYNSCANRSETPSLGGGVRSCGSSRIYIRARDRVGVMPRVGGTRIDIAWELFVSLPSVVAAIPDLVMGIRYIKFGLKGLHQSRGSLQAPVNSKAVLEGLAFFQNSPFQIILLPLRE